MEQEEEISTQPEQNEETRMQKKNNNNNNNNNRLRNLGGNFKHSNIQIMGVPEGEEEEQQIENLLGNIMKENYHNLAKEIDSRKSRKPKESQRNWTRGSTQ